MVDIDLSQLCRFTPKQLVATSTSDKHKYVLFGGSRGPGKSYWLRWALLRLVLIYRRYFGVPNPVVALFCEDYPVLRDRQIVKIKAEFPQAMGTVKSTQEAGLGFYLRGGGMIALRNLDDPSKYQSAEFAAIGVDELTKSSKETFDILRSSLRWPGIPSEWWKFLGATNPGGPGHLWVKSLWVDSVFPTEMEALAPQFAFVPALPDDNPYLEPAYWQMLESLPHALAQAWRYGSWDVFEGQVFAEWRRDLHVIEPDIVPATWTRWRAVDWGYRVPMCCLWFAKDPDSGRIWVYRELYESGLTDPEQAERIRQRTRGNERIQRTYADPSMWTPRTVERQTITSADVFRDYGVPLTKANNDRLIGKRRVHEALAYKMGNGEPVYEDGKPGLQVFTTCRNLIRTLPALPYDDTRVEDVDTDAEDHAYDALRYGLLGRVPGRRAKPKVPGDYWGAARGPVGG